MMESVSPVKREMLSQGYDDAKPDRFEAMVNYWLTRMRNGGSEGREIAELLKDSWLRHKKTEWLKGGLVKRVRQRLEL